MLSAPTALKLNAALVTWLIVVMQDKSIRPPALAWTPGTQIAIGEYAASIAPPDLARQSSERVRVWDSCFNPEHGYIHGKNMRPTTADRYRMWMTHKLGTWVEQFGSSGCTGCGRCITWCPAGIDLVAEAIAVLEENQ